MSYYESLQNYYKNGRVLHLGKDSVWGEIGYEEYMKQKISDLGIKSGDVIKVEVKGNGRKVVNYEGIVLHMYKDRFHMLSKGKKIWKDKSNREDIIIRYITKIEKVKDAAKDFDIYEADPDYKYVQEHKEDNTFWDEIEKKRVSKFQERIKSVFPDIDQNKNVILWLLFDFCWDYDNGVVNNAEINIIKKDGQVIPVPAFKIKHIYPNKSYYTCCGVKNTDEERDGILMMFDSFEELSEIRLISCKWTVEIDSDPDKESLQFMQMVYPTFIKGEYNVYNIPCRCTDMQLYEESLHSHSVFSGRLEEEYDKAFVYMEHKEGESVMDIMNTDDMDSIVSKYSVDFCVCLNNNSLEKMLDGLGSSQRRITEIFMKYPSIESKGYTWRY